jgi:type 1 glutamine amidotransferase
MNTLSIKHLFRAFFLFALLISLGLGNLFAQTPATSTSTSTSTSSGPIEALLVTGGCCHDYDFQAKAMQLAAKKRNVPIRWTIVNEGGTGNEAEIGLYEKPDWSAGFDVVIHNECFAKTTNPEYIRKITQAHEAGTNAVVIHCAMHTYRDATIDDWREFLGVTSRRHDHQSRYPVKVTAAEHSIMKGFPTDYVSVKDELYIIEKLWPNAQALATSKSEKTGDEHPVFWVNNYGKARVFGTTYGHSTETFSDEVFLDTLIRGIQWTTESR